MGTFYTIKTDDSNLLQYAGRKKMILHKNLNSDLQDWCRPDQETDSTGRLEFYFYYGATAIIESIMLLRYLFFPLKALLWWLFMTPTVQNIFSNLLLLIVTEHASLLCHFLMETFFHHQFLLQRISILGFFHKSWSVITSFLRSFFFKDFCSLT